MIRKPDLDCERDGSQGGVIDEDEEGVTERMNAILKITAGRSYVRSVQVPMLTQSSAIPGSA